MIPNPRRFLSLACIGIALFALLAVLLVSDSFLIRLDNWLADHCYHFTLEHPRVHDFFRSVTDLGWGRFLNWIGGTTVLLLLVRREWFRSAIWTIGLLATHEIVPFLKDQFQRPRPEFADIGGLSFPSGHSFGSAVVYGLLGILVLRIWQCSRWRLWFACSIWALIPLVALSRMMLGVHYFSDVLAGMSAGLAWAFLVEAGADAYEKRKNCSLETKAS